jgi:tetratricopeptide (TPR) repeat protein
LTRARTLEAAGGLDWWAGEIESCRDRYEQALALVRGHAANADVANALYNAALSHGLLGSTDTALRYHDEARQIYELLGDEAGVAKCLWGWGTSAQTANQNQDARLAFEKALSLYQGLDDTFSLAWTHHMLGLVLLRLGEPGTALPHLDAGIKLFNAADDISGINLILRNFAQLAVDLGETEQALVLAGALSALEEDTGLRLRDAFSMPIEGLEATREAVGEERAIALISQGQQMSRKQVLKYVLSWNPAGMRGGRQPV